MELHGLAPGKYRVHDYVNDKGLGEVDAANPVLQADLIQSLLLETTKE